MFLIYFRKKKYHGSKLGLFQGYHRGYYVGLTVLKCSRRLFMKTGSHARYLFLCFRRDCNSHTKHISTGFSDLHDAYYHRKWLAWQLLLLFFHISLQSVTLFWLWCKVFRTAQKAIIPSTRFVLLLQMVGWTITIKKELQRFSIVHSSLIVQLLIKPWDMY